MKNIFLTGGTGFLGSHILYELSILEYNITAIKRKKSSLSLIKNLFLINNQEHKFKKIKWINCDITDLFKLESLICKNDIVIHCAGYISFEKRKKNQIFDINYYATKNLVNICLKKQISKFCYISSIATLFNKKNSIADENSWFSNSNTKSYYAKSKYMGEMEVWRGFAEGLNGFIINPSLVIGPGDKNSLFGKMISKLKKRTLFYPGGGTGFVDVRDVSSVMIKLINKKVNHKRYIINSQNLSFKELLTIYAKQVNGPIPSIKINNNIIKIAILLSKIFNPYNNLSFSIVDFFKTKSRYSNLKIKQELNYKFISVQRSIIDII